ncbi:MAG: anthrone oxygenase family protein [Candidatus Acidiferrales bacterium]
MEQVLQLAVLVFAALATGGLMVNWIGLGRAMSRLSVSAYVEFHQATNHTFEPYMPIVVVGALLGGIVLAILSPGIHSLSAELAIAGSVCYAAVLAVTLPTNVRINKQIARWSVQNPPDDWARIRDSWVRFHIVRTLFSLPGLVCYILACLVSR